MSLSACREEVGLLLKSAYLKLRDWETQSTLEDGWWREEWRALKREFEARVYKLDRPIIAAIR
jgi:hypothetical protein